MAGERRGRGCGASGAGALRGNLDVQCLERQNSTGPVGMGKDPSGFWWSEGNLASTSPAHWAPGSHCGLRPDPPSSEAPQAAGAPGAWEGGEGEEQNWTERGSGEGVQRTGGTELAFPCPPGPGVPAEVPSLILHSRMPKIRRGALWAALSSLYPQPEPFLAFYFIFCYFGSFLPSSSCFTEMFLFSNILVSFLSLFYFFNPF